MFCKELLTPQIASLIYIGHPFGRLIADSFQEYKMDNQRPVIILGAGIWGQLLAYRLSQSLPHINFKLCTTSGLLGEGNSWTFWESELEEENLKWVNSLISYSWDCHRIVFSGRNRTLKNRFCLVLAGELENVINKTYSVEKLGPETNMEQLLSRASFIIDTRHDPRQKSNGYRHTLGIMVQLHENHGLELPVTMDAGVRQQDIFRHMQYFPLNPRTVLVKDVRYCKEASLKVEGSEDDLLREIRKRWRIKQVLHQETEFILVPSGKIRPWNHGRIISLAGLINPVTADQFTEAVKVIDLMVKTSFRLGELKKAIVDYRSRQKLERRFSRLVVKMIYHSPHPSHRQQLLEYLFKLPLEGLEKFRNGRIGAVDIGKALLWRPSIPLFRAIGFMMSNKSTEIQEMTP